MSGKPTYEKKLIVEYLFNMTIIHRLWEDQLAKNKS